MEELNNIIGAIGFLFAIGGVAYLFPIMIAMIVLATKEKRSEHPRKQRMR